MHGHREDSQTPYRHQRSELTDITEDTRQQFYYLDYYATLFWTAIFLTNIPKAKHTHRLLTQ